MTTPQSILYNLHHKINELIKEFDAEDGEFIIRINDLHEEMIEINKSISVLADTMALILKVLNEKDK